MSGIDYGELLEWASPQQRAIVLELKKHGSRKRAAEALGMSRDRLRAALTKLRRKAAKRGWAPDADMTHKTPPGFHTKGTSTLYDAQGNVVQQWHKTGLDSQHRTEILLEQLETLKDKIKGKSLKSPKPRKTNEDLLCVYPMGDPHLGMLATAEESGEDFDLETAEENLVEAVDKLVTLAPAAKQALIINLGDFFHSDNQQNRTARSGHSLDVSSPWTEVVKVGLKTMRRCIDKAAEKHEKVRVICCIGNHDDHSAYMLALALDAYYENNPRIEVDTTPSAFHWYRFGVNLIGAHHGNGAKASQLPSIMAHDRAKDWGETKNHCRWFYCGHIHHDTLKEYPGCVVETFRTLAAKDRYTHSHGYRSGRDMKLDVIHRTQGKTNRYIVGVEQLTPKGEK